MRLCSRDRGAATAPDWERGLEQPAIAHFSTPGPQKEETLPKPAGKLSLPRTATAVTLGSPEIASLPVVAALSLLESMDQIPGASLLTTREGLGECTPCKLHSTRHQIVPDDANPS